MNKSLSSYCVCPVFALSLLALTPCCGLRPDPNPGKFHGEWQCGGEPITVYPKGKALVAGKKAIWGHLGHYRISIEYREKGEPKSVELGVDRKGRAVALLEGHESEVDCEKKASG
jgi:hypothetical protein